jgi:tetratricopeptide (TPR) repeat protein
MYTHSRHTLALLLSLVFLTLLPPSLQAQNKKKKREAKEQVAIVPAKSTTDIPEAQAHFDRGARDFANKQYDSALSHYRAALKVDPSFLNALDQMALAFRLSGQADSAAHYFRLSAATNPNGLLAHQELATLYAQQKDHRNALREYQEILRISPNDPEAYTGLSKSLFMLENFAGSIESGKKAVQLFEKAKTDNPTLGEAQYFVGMSFFYTENRESAKLYLKRAKSNGVPIPKDLQNELNIK